MKTLNLLLLITLIALVTVSCSKEELSVKQETQLNEDETFTFHDVDENKLITFNSQQEFINYLSNNPKYSSLEKKMEAFRIEQNFIEKNQLYRLDKNSKEVTNYLSKFETGLKTASGALYDGFNGTGSRLGYTHVPNPRLRRSRWDKASSWKGLKAQVGLSIILCGQTFYRGSKYVIHCSPGGNGEDGLLNLYQYNNNTRSYY